MEGITLNQIVAFIVGLAGVISALTIIVKTIKKPMDSMQNKLGDIDSKINVMEVKVNRIDTKVTGLSEEVNALKTKVNSLDTSMGSLSVKVDELQKNVDENVRESGIIQSKQARDTRMCLLITKHLLDSSPDTTDNKKIKNDCNEYILNEAVRAREGT